MVLPDRGTVVGRFRGCSEPGSRVRLYKLTTLKITASILLQHSKAVSLLLATRPTNFLLPISDKTALSHLKTSHEADPRIRRQPYLCFWPGCVSIGGRDTLNSFAEPRTLNSPLSIIDHSLP